MMASSLSNEQLIDIPESNLLPGELRRAFSVRAEHRGKEEEVQEQQQQWRQASLVRAEKEADEAREAELVFAERSALLLERIQEREQDIAEEARTLDKRTIKLGDGRRAYVDGDKFRDERGRELHGHDRAEAEQLHLEMPSAVTWQERQDLDRRERELKVLRQRAEQATKNGDEKTLSTTEKAFADAVAARVKGKASDYGSGDCLTDPGLSGDFGLAARADTPALPTSPVGTVKPNTPAPH